MTVTPKLRLRRVGAVQVAAPVYQTAGSAGLDLCAALARRPDRAGRATLDSDRLDLRDSGGP